MPAHSLRESQLSEDVINRIAEVTSKKSEEALKNVLGEVGSTGVKPSSKLSQVLENLRKKEGKEGEPPLHSTNESEIERIKSEKEKLEREKSKLEESITECPNCVSKGHSHALLNIGGGKVRCTGDDCKKEYVLVDGNSDYKCATCGIPHIRPASKEDEKKDKCPFCGGEKFDKFNLTKIKEKATKKKWL